ncbi:MAG: DUF2063 domain-containing protein [Guyparkeria sp.]
MSDDFRAAQQAFTRFVRDPDHHALPPGSRPERMAWYARLFFNNVDGMLETAFPALAASLSESDWQGLGRAFFRDCPQTSPLMRDLPARFVDYLAENPGRAAGLSDWQRELLPYELARFELLSEDEPPPPTDLNPAGDLLDGRPMRSPIVRLMIAAYPVDQIAAELENGRAPTIPAPGLHHVLLHRDRRGAPCALQLSPASAQLLIALDEAEPPTGREIITAVAARLDHPEEALTPLALAELERWREQGILLGSRPSG